MNDMIKTSINGTTLSVRGELRNEDEPSLNENLLKLFFVPGDPVVDLNGVSYMSSKYIGTFYEYSLKCKNAGKKLKMKFSDKFMSENKEMFSVFLNDECLMEVAAGDA